MARRLLQLPSKVCAERAHAFLSRFYGVATVKTVRRDESPSQEVSASLSVEASAAWGLDATISVMEQPYDSTSTYVSFHAVPGKRTRTVRRFYAVVLALAGLYTLVLLGRLVILSAFSEAVAPELGTARDVSWGAIGSLRIAAGGLAAILPLALLASRLGRLERRFWKYVDAEDTSMLVDGSFEPDYPN